MILNEQIWLLMMVELLFGTFFNAFTALCERKRWIEGYTSLFVVIGVAVTLLIITPELGLDSLLILVLAFTGSGLPMIVGSIIRHITARSLEERGILSEARE